jgi:hypothetical protein
MMLCAVSCHFTGLFRSYPPPHAAGDCWLLLRWRGSLSFAASHSSPPSPFPLYSMDLVPYRHRNHHPTQPKQPYLLQHLFPTFPPRQPNRSYQHTFYVNLSTRLLSKSPTLHFNTPYSTITLTHEPASSTLLFRHFVFHTLPLFPHPASHYHPQLSLTARWLWCAVLLWLPYC